MGYALPPIDRRSVNLAGETFRRTTATIDEVLDAWKGLFEWRAAHAYPLLCLYVLLSNRAKRITANSIVAQRLKRYPSILAKLRREPSMKLSQMQDIGGCRAIMPTISEVVRLRDLFTRVKKDRHTLGGVKDYIHNPKPDGYRGVHIVCKYNATSQSKRVYNGMKVEIQIRSRLQHAWATAVEVVDAFKSSSLKSGLKQNLGDPNWRRFFALMGSVIARKEGQPLVPGTPEDESVLKSELRLLASQLRVRETLRGLNLALNVEKHLRETELKARSKDLRLYLLELDLRANKVRFTAFKHSQSEDANRLYAQRESENIEDSSKLFVLVAVRSLKALKAAYPNYYMDTTTFVKTLSSVIDA